MVNGKYIQLEELRVGIGPLARVKKWAMLEGRKIYEQLNHILNAYEEIHQLENQICNDCGIINKRNFRDVLAGKLHKCKCGCASYWCESEVQAEYYKLVLESIRMLYERIKQEEANGTIEDFKRKWHSGELFNEKV